jgi:acetyltransferase-like isoleucine patch superfamily enzyme
MTRLGVLLRYDWPLHFVILLTNWLPDNIPFLRLRGRLARPFFGECGSDLRLGRHLTFYNPSRIKMGAHVYLAYGCVFLASGEKICIGDEVIMGPYCVLASEDHLSSNHSFRYGPTSAAPIVVERGCWLGAHVVVTAGSRIGKGTLVAAGAVVARSIPDHVLAGGVPACVIKERVE